jgi:hypothetical protein
MNDSQSAWMVELKTRTSILFGKRARVRANTIQIRRHLIGATLVVAHGRAPGLPLRRMEIGRQLEYWTK